MATKSKNPQRWQELQNIVGEPGKVDENSLTDEELAKRLGAFQEMGSFGADFNPQKMARALQERLTGNGLTPQEGERVGWTIANDVQRLGSFNALWGDSAAAIRPQVGYRPSTGSGGDRTLGNTLQNDPAFLNYTTGLGLIPTASGTAGSDPITNAVLDAINLTRQEYDQGGYNVGPGDYTGDIKRLSDLTTSRKNRAKAQSDVDQLVSSLPQELMRGRQQLFQGEADSANQYYNDQLAPEVMQGLNSRGLLYSGDLESELNRAAGNVQGSLENAYMDQQSQDDAFFQNAAYQQTFMNEIQAGNDVTGQIQNQRGQAMQNQNMSFQRTQADLSRQFQALLQQKQQTRQLEAQDAQYRRAQDANKPNQWQALGQAVGTVGGAVVGNMVAPGIGGYIGAGVGGQIGGAGGSAIPGRLNT